MVLLRLLLAVGILGPENHLIQCETPEGQTVMRRPCASWHVSAMRPVLCFLTQFDLVTT